MVLGGAVGEAVLPGGLAGTPPLETRRIQRGARDASLKPGGLRCGLDAPSAGSHDSTVSLWCESGIHSEQGRPDLWRQVVGAGSPSPGQHPRPAPPPPRCFRPVLATCSCCGEADAPGEPCWSWRPPAVSSEMVLALTRWAEATHRSGGGPGPKLAPRAHCPEAPTSLPCSPSSSAAITAPTSPSMTAGSKEFLCATQAP